jgi:hypothetical protein
MERFCFLGIKEVFALLGKQNGHTARQGSNVTFIKEGKNTSSIKGYDVGV